MFYRFSSLFLYLLLSLPSCGNPHLRDSNGIETNRPAQDSENSTTAGSTAGGSTTGGSTTGGSTTGGSTQQIRPYFGSAAQGTQGAVETGFCGDLLICNWKRETFQSILPGQYRIISGTSVAGYSLEVSSQSLSYSTNFDTLFGNRRFSFLIESILHYDSASGIDAGLKASESGNHAGKRTILWSFSAPVSFWGATVLDLESTSHSSALVRGFDCSKSLLFELPVRHPSNETGDKEVHFVGFRSNFSNICYVTLSVNDTSDPTLGIDDFYYGDCNK